VSFSRKGTFVFSLKEKVVYPGHGVAEVTRILEKKIGVKKSSFFELKFLNKDMTILIPVENAESVGIRPLSSSQSIHDLFIILSQPAPFRNLDAPTVNWSKRNKEYLGKLRTGDLKEICTIYRELRHISARKELSFGERNLLQKTEVLLAEEISIVENIAQDKAVERVRHLVL